MYVVSGVAAAATNTSRVITVLAIAAAADNGRLVLLHEGSPNRKSR